MQISAMETAKLAELAKQAVKRGYKYAQVQPGKRLVLGADLFNPTHEINFTDETIQPISVPVSTPGPNNLPAPVPPRATRRSGEYSLEIKGETITCVSLKELLAEGLKALEKHRVGTLDNLAKIMPRSKRIVSRDPAGLFKNPELSQKYSEKLVGEWWFGTNNSALETVTWLRRAAELAGLEWGNDIRTNVG